MFKKLKDKIAEESTKLQQIAQAAGYNIPGNDVNTDSFFSITDDTPQNSPLHKPQSNIITPTSNGAGPRTRRLSNSSQASDVSFKLPSYNPESPAVFHLQSDMESASELDESGSVAAMGGQLDLVSKEQLHQAYKKALDRYQKYRGMYTDLARRYRELERDNTKARAVLVETQDKALRRISELREQCSLEQQAKAHLEAALRLEMDELQCVVKTLTTKLELMGVNTETELNNDKNTENLIQLDSKADTVSHASSEFSSPLTSQSTDLDRKISDLETQIKQLNELAMEKDAKIIILSEESKKLKHELKETTTAYENLKSKDENNTILLAENKMVIHSELEAKENEMKSVKAKLEQLEADFKEADTKNKTLTDQVNSLKKQLLESKTVNQASKEMHSSQMSQMEAALTSSRNEKHELELKLVDIEKQSNDFKTENVTLSASLTKTKEEKVKIEEQLNTIKGQITTLQDELKAALAKNDLFVSKISEIYLQSCKEKFDGNPESVKKIHDHLNELNVKIETLSQEKLTLETDKAKIEQRLTQLFEEKQKVNANLKEIQEESQKKDKEIENLKLQANSAVSNEDKFKNLQESYESKLTDLESKLNQKEIDLQILTENLNQTQSELNSKENEIKSLHIKVQELEIGCRKSQEKLVTELEPINNELARLRQELVEKCLEIERITQEKVEISKENDMKSEKITSIETELKNVAQEKERISIELEKTMENLRTLESKIAELTETNENLNKELQDQRHEKQDHSSEITTLKNKVDLLRKEKNDLEKTLEREIREKSELKTQVVNILKEITRLEEQLNEVKTSHSQIQSEKEQLEQKFEEFNEKSLKEIENTKKLREELQNVNIERAELEAKLKGELEKVTTEKAELEIRLRDLQERVNQAESNLEGQSSYEIEIHEKNTKLKEFEEQNANIKSQLTQCLEENAKLLDEKELLEHKVRSLQDDVEVKEKEKLTVLDTNQCLVDSLNQQKSQVSVVKDQITALEEQKSALTETCDSLMEKVDALKKENISLRSEREQFQQRLEEIQGQLEEANNKHSIRENKIRMLTDENKNIKADHDGNVSKLEELEMNLRKFESENTELRKNVHELKSELEEYQNQNGIVEEIQVFKQEIEQLKQENSKLSTEISNQSDSQDQDQIIKERDQLKAKLDEIMTEIAGINSNANDLATRNLFLEQKCENYLILEQSNERLKNQVEKLSRQLDETLVSLHHNEGLAANTEFEYLRNILFQYLSGSAGANGKTLVKVIAAVLKFTPQQTQVVVEKETHRHSLVGQINNLL
uniref:CSON007269 protein n=1 Tax=Culicoides sonorensis TaxID=179676 RepID=A0A336MUT9_CULSO